MTLISDELIQKIVQSIPPNFYDDVEQPGALTKVLYSDTDSIFITIPTKAVEKLTKEQKWDIVLSESAAINKIIQNYLNNIFLKRANCNIDYNKTDFKSEFQYEMMMFLPVKKQYAYKIVCKEGVFFDPPKVKYTGIQIVRSDAAQWTQDLLREMIEGVIFNQSIPDNKKVEATIKVIQEYQNKLKQAIEQLNFIYIGLPGKWSKKKLIINGMKLFNYLIGQEVFSFGSAGKFVYCDVPKNLGDYNGITVPYEYDKDLLKQKFQEYGIKVSFTRMWETLFTTTCQHVVKIVKESV